MCGRYAASRNPDELVEIFEVDQWDGAGPGSDPTHAEPDYNVAPTKQAPVVLERTGRAGDAGTIRWLRLLRWGLVPSWAKDPKTGNRMINARAETLLDKPAYRRAALARRCLVPADGWYEWRPDPVGATHRGRPRRQPYLMLPRSGELIAFAGVYELWRDPGRDPDDPAAWLASYAVITAAAEPELATIHDRMPLVLPADRWDAWLDPSRNDPDEVRELLVAPAGGRFLARTVTAAVNSAANNGPDLWTPDHGGDAPADER